MRRAFVGLAIVVLAAGCGELPELPPLPDPVAIGETPALPTPTPGATTLSPDGFRTTERVAVRVRNVGCGGVSTGSGFAVSSDVLVTNRHVVAGAETLQVSTYDGQDLLVETAGAAVVADLAIVNTRSPLPAAVTLADADPQAGDQVEVVGYPGGGRLTTSSGTVLGYGEDPLNVNAGRIVRTDAPARPGSSGSPMYDDAGQVVGVVYAATQDGTQSLAVPVSTLQELLDQTSFDDDVPSCE
ncbi:MAG: S1C family serine protease [Jiangellaceae bacterium]